jgi:hypothetical protein
MNKSTLKHRLLGFGLAAALLLTAPVCLQAWTVMILLPEQPVSIQSDLEAILASGLEPFTNYVKGRGADVTFGPLADFQVGVTADAVVTFQPGSGDGTGHGETYTAPELAVLGALLNSNVPTLVFGEHPVWDASNAQLAAVVGGTYVTGQSYTDIENPQTFIADAGILTAGLTLGVSQIGFAAAGAMLPGPGGYSLTSGDSISLWGANNNFLVVLDGNAITGGDVTGYDNDQFVQNVAGFLTTAIPVPEPAAWAALAGLAMLICAALRRRRR